MAAFAERPKDEVDAPALPTHLADEATHARAHDEVADRVPVSVGKPDPLALLPWMDLDFGFEHASKVRTPPLPLAAKEQLEVIEARTSAEKLLTGKDTEGGHALKAVDAMSSLPDAERAAVIDSLSPQAFQAMFDEIPPGDRTRFAALVDASQDPKRKLKMWKDMHFARVQSDGASYSEDVGTDDEPRTDAQRAAKIAADRRQLRVDDDRNEVDAELARLDALDKQGRLTVADVDELRGRKDRELAFEQKYNVDLTADPNAKWSKSEIESMDAAFEQLPADHVHGENMVPKIARKPPGYSLTQGGEYVTSAVPEIDVSDPAHHQASPIIGQQRSSMVDPELARAHGTSVDSFEYTVTHEMGHRWGFENPDVFKKFEKIAGWKKIPAADIEKAPLSDAAREELEARRHGATVPETGLSGKDIEQGGKLYTTRNLSDGAYETVDASAFPARPDGQTEPVDGWRYAKSNSLEHFAEMYAHAVHAPEAFYSEFVGEPEAAAADAQKALASGRAALAQAHGDERAQLQARVEELTRNAADAARAAKQRTDEFRLMRNDVFHADEAQKEAEERLRARHVSDRDLRAFEQEAARASTPAQIAALENKRRS